MTHPKTALPADPVTPPTPVYQPLDSTCWGAMMGLILYMAAKAQITLDSQLELAAKDIDLARLMGLIKGNLTELHGLLAEPTSKISGLTGLKESRAIKLVYEINLYCYQVGFVFNKSEGEPSAKSSFYSLSNPFRAGERIAQTWHNPEAAVQAEKAAWVQTWADLRAETLSATKSDSDVGLNAKRIHIVADFMEGFAFDGITSAGGYSFEGGQTVASDTYLNPVTQSDEEIWPVFIEAFTAQREALLALNKTDVTGAYNNLDAWLLGRKEYRLPKPELDNLSGGVLMSDDGTMIEGFSIMVGAESDSKNQLINKSTSAAGNGVQQVNSLYDAAKGTLDQLGRASKSSLNY